MTLIDKFYNEHRVAYSAIVEIENSNESAEIKTDKIIKLFNEELIPHFKQEEDELFKDDFASVVLMEEHKQVYELIEKLKADKKEKYVRQFCTIMKRHIKMEDKYFGEMNRGQSVMPFVITAVIFLFIGVIVGKSIN